MEATLKWRKWKKKRPINLLGSVHQLCDQPTGQPTRCKVLNGLVKRRYFSLASGCSTQIMWCISSASTPTPAPQRAVLLLSVCEANLTIINRIFSCFLMLLLRKRRLLLDRCFSLWFTSMFCLPPFFVVEVLLQRISSLSWGQLRPLHRPVASVINRLAVCLATLRIYFTKVLKS